MRNPLFSVLRITLGFPSSTQSLRRLLQGGARPKRGAAARWDRPRGRAEAARSSPRPPPPRPRSAARRPCRAEAGPAVSVAAGRPPARAPPRAPLGRRRGPSWSGCGGPAGGMGLELEPEPLFQAWSYFRRRKFRQCSDLCSQLLERPPGEQVTGAGPGGRGGRWWWWCQSAAARPPDRASTTGPAVYLLQPPERPGVTAR